MIDRHLTDADMPLFTQLRMTAFGQTVIDLANDPACDEWTFSQKIFHALDKEITARQERRTQKLLKASRSPNPDACVEEIRYLPDRNINRELIARLSSCQWIDSTRNLVACRCLILSCFVRVGAADFPFPSAGQDCCHAFTEEASGDVELG